MAACVIILRDIGPKTHFTFMKVCMYSNFETYE